MHCNRNGITRATVHMDMGDEPFAEQGNKKKGVMPNLCPFRNGEQHR